MWSPASFFVSALLSLPIVGAAAGLMAWQMQDIVSILLVAFTINSAALFIPTIAMVGFKKINKAAAFWSMTLALLTVIAWYVASAMSLADVFTLDPLWPGLIVSVTSFFIINFASDSQE